MCTLNPPSPLHVCTTLAWPKAPLALHGEPKQGCFVLSCELYILEPVRTEKTGSPWLPRLGFETYIVGKDACSTGHLATLVKTVQDIIGLIMGGICQ